MWLKEQQLKTVYFVNPLAETIAERLSDPRCRVGSHLRQMLAAVPRRWEETTLDEILGIGS